MATDVTKMLAEFREALELAWSDYGTLGDLSATTLEKMQAALAAFTADMPEAIGFMVSLACEIVSAGPASPTAKRHLAKLEGK